MGTITVKKPGDTDIRTLIDRIEPLPFLDFSKRAPIAMLLVTPSFASALQTPSASTGAVPEAVTQATSRLVQDLLERESDVGEIRIIAAVVDRLPSPEGGSQASKGREGLAYAMWFNDNVARHSWESVTSDQRGDNAACLTLDVYDRFKLTDPAGNPRRSSGDSVHRLHLPLANTIFQTGQPSMMYNILYHLSDVFEPKSGPGAILPNPRTLHVYTANMVKSQRVTWPVAGRYLAHRRKHHPSWEKTLHQLHVPLLPLTGPRLVEAGMGNIIRQISGPDGKTAPASQELEKAVSSFFEATGQDPHAMPVWALVCKESTVKYFSEAVLRALGKWRPARFSPMYDYAGRFGSYAGEAWNVDHRIFQPAIWRALAVGGASLHRVLSGGGGWGKKAGLISLDPTTSAQDVQSAQPMPTGETSPAIQGSLEAAAKPGSYITFFTSPASSLDVPKYEPDTSVFGTLPSSIDDIPDTTTEGPPGIDFWPGYFGALSEKGMSLKFIHRYEDHKEFYTKTMVDEMQELQRQRSLHTRANPAFGMCPVRYFSSTPMSQFPKSKDYLKSRLTPISARLREIDPIRKVPEDKAEDFRMTLDKYPHYWKFSRWLAEYSKAELDARPIPPRPGKTRAKGVLALRAIWENRIDACKRHMERLVQGHMRMLQLQVKALAQYADRTITPELKRLPPIRHKILHPSAIQVLSGGSALTWTLRAIKAEERAVAPLPFRAPELVQVLHDRVHKSQILCKKLEDRVYPVVIRYRRRSKQMRKMKMKKRMNKELASTRSVPEPSNTNGVKYTVAQDSHDALGALSARTSTGIRHELKHEYYIIRRPPTWEHHRRLSYSHRYTAPDSPISSSSSPPPPKEAKVDDPFESLSSAFSSFLEDMYVGHRPDSPAEETKVGYTADDVQLLFHQNQFRDTRQYFGRRRRVGLQRLQEMADSVATIRRHELNYLDDAVELSDVVCIELMLQCAHVNPAAWKLQLERSAGRVSPYKLQQTNMWPAMWPAMWHVDKIDGVAVHDQIKRLRWRVLRWSRKAKIGDEEVNKRLQKVMEILQEGERGTWAFRMMKTRLEEMVLERLRSETRGWQRRKYQDALKKLLTGEIAYLREAITASERNLEIMGRMLFFIQQGAKEELDRQKGAMENVRRTLPDRELERVNEAWTLANDLAALLSSK
ncbi:hypothetical protein SLS55_010480 [Diplodia seriata]|uniref:Uncharacterized protein n=1 Tax=Diplodia seriata TaxID=420778 RepID=A0ABR3BXC2_9PEZI